MSPCSISGCPNGARKRGWCPTHYSRYLEWGDPRPDIPIRPRYPTREDSFAARAVLDRASGCMNWQGNRNRKGYGYIAISSGKDMFAHRYAWERKHGPVPEGMVVDHICHNSSCVNAEHLRLATVEQNQQHRASAQSGRKYALPRGVYVHREKFEAKVTRSGVVHRLGVFASAEEAAAAAEAKRAELFGEFAGGGDAR